MKHLTFTAIALALLAASIPTPANAAGCRIWKRTIYGLRCVCYYGQPCFYGPQVNR